MESIKAGAIQASIFWTLTSLLLISNIPAALRFVKNHRVRRERRREMRRRKLRDFAWSRPGPSGILYGTPEGAFQCVKIHKN
jgi:hypothetical protein